MNEVQDRAFREVEAIMRTFEGDWEAVVAARNIWVRSPDDDGTGRMLKATAFAAGQVPDDPAYVRVPAPEKEALYRPFAHLAALALGFLQPVADDPARMAAMRQTLREQLGLLLDQALNDAEQLAGELARIGMAGPAGDREE